MGNKVTNIYIDTTGFCDEALDRVDCAISVIVKHNRLEITRPLIKKCAPRCYGFDAHGVWHAYFAKYGCNPCTNAQPVGLWELESIAFRCKQEKKEAPLPTRNIYIDARKLDPVERLCAFQAFLEISKNEPVDFAPAFMDARDHGNDAFVLFDYYATKEDGRPHCSNGSKF